MRKLIGLSEVELQRLQQFKLDQVLTHARKKSVYYRGLQEVIDSGIVVERLKTFPILTKALIREHSKALCTEPIDALLPQKSSGSSGFQSTVYWSKKEQDIHRATQTLWWEWAGYSFGLPILQTGITPNRGLVKKMKDTVLNTLYLQAFTHSEQDVEEVMDWVRKKRSVFFAGYASSLYAITQLYKGPSVQFGSAISWGDKLFPHYRRLIEEKFCCKVFETYGSAEGMMMAAQKDLPYMYIMTPNVWMELLDDDDKEVPDGEMGHVVVTNLNGYGMPLIRYKIGDLAIKLPRAEYPEHRQLALPLLKRVIGRDTDLVLTPQGKKMIVHSFTGVFEHFPSIKQFSVVQENLDGVTINYIPDIGFDNEVLEEIRLRLMHFIDEPFEINFIAVEQIPRTPSGKPQIIVSKLKRN